tara:strand:+ start:513 stop:755 length:243 start_codon:yes stop_codon:yes gene_type:complete
MEDISKMSKKDDKLDKILESLEELTNMLVEDFTEGIMDDRPEWMEETPGEAIQAFRITERVVREMREQFGEEWMDHMGIT